jgi:general secretion pathway protein K
LWILALLALVAASFTLTSHTDIEIARNQVAGTEARQLADSGVARAIVGLNDPQPARRWVADGRPYRWRFGDGEVAISVVDESGKINLNAAPREALESAFRSAGAGDALSGDLADAVLDRRQGASHLTSNGQAFIAIEDLQTLPGMTAPLYYRATLLFTVYGQSPGVNSMVAARDVLLALPDADPGEIDSFLADRAAAREPGAGAIPPTPPLSVARYLSGGMTGIVTISARATTATGAVFVRAATITLQSNAATPFITDAWKQLLTIE